MKRILALVLSVLMLASCFVIATSAEEADLAAVYAGAQTKAYTTADGDFYDVRFLATLDETALTNKKVVFTITATYGAGEQVFEVDTDTVYTSVLSGTNTVAPSAFKAEHEYFAAVAVKGISKAAYGNVVFAVSIKAVAADDSDVASAGNNFVSFNGGAEVNPAPVFMSYASDAGNQHNNNTYKAESIFDTTNTDTNFTFNNSVKGFVVGGFVTPTVITKITYYGSSTAPNRVRQNTFEASVDGKTWVTLATLPNPAETTTYTFDIADATPYNFLRLSQRNAGEWWTVGTIAVEGIELAQPTPLNVTSYKNNVTLWRGSDGVNPSNGGSVDYVWDTTNTASKTTAYAPGANAAEPNWIAGKFDKATVINKVVYYAPLSNGNRARGGTIEASVDGETWVVIHKLDSNGDMYQANDIIVMDITDTTEYNYIRIVQGSGYKAYDWSVGTVVVY